jgi:DNA-binding MarR family transcriptional regulator
MSENLSDRQHAVNAAQAFGRLVVQVFRLEGALTIAGDALARPAGQTTARWRVLAAVEETPATVAQIARAWSLARQSVQRVADVLERDGLVTFEDNPSHRRAKLVRLTPKGRAALRRIQPAQRAWAARLGKEVGTRELEHASATLARVLEALERERN